MTQQPEPDIIVLARKMRYDLTALQAKVTDLINMLTALDLETDPAPFTCPKCNAPFNTERALAFHDQHVHDGPPVPLTPEEEAA